MRFLICSLIVVVIFGAGCYPNPEGGPCDSIFVKYYPDLVGGDGLSYETAYRFEHGEAGRGFLSSSEYKLIQQRHWPSLPPDEGAYYSKYGRETPCVTETRAGKLYHVYTFDFPDGKHSIYFDVTYYAKKTSH
jgi:hypothetical protein